MNKTTSDRLHERLSDAWGSKDQECEHKELSSHSKGAPTLPFSVRTSVPQAVKVVAKFKAFDLDNGQPIFL